LRAGIIVVACSFLVKKGGKVKPPYTTGFTLLFPPNDIRSPITFGVRRPDLSNQPIVPLST